MGKKKEVSPEEARAKRAKKAQKKKAARKRNTSIAAAMGAAFSFIFVGTVLVLLFKIKLAVNERDKVTTTEPFRVPEIAVTEVSSMTDSAVTTTAPVTTTTPATTTADPLVVVPDGDGSTVVVKKKLKTAANSIYDLEPLKTQINDLIGGFQGDWQIYLRHTASNKEISIDNKPLYAASLIKLFAAGAAYQKVKEGSLNADYADELIRPMIAESDNNAFDELIEQIGQSAVTEWCRQQGYWDTVVSHEISDDYAYTNNRVADTDNTTSSQDAGRFLNALYRGEIVSRDYSEKLLGYLKEQTMRSKIPEGVPTGTVVANKTGETDDVDHDAAIVFCDTGDYVLVVMGDTPGFGWTADIYISQVSDLVYKYFNGDPNASSESEEESEGEETSSASDSAPAEDSSSTDDSSAAE